MFEHAKKERHSVQTDRFKPVQRHNFKCQHQPQPVEQRVTLPFLHQLFILAAFCCSQVTSGPSSLTMTPQSSPSDGLEVTIIKADSGSGSVTVGSLRAVSGGSYTISGQYNSCTILAVGGYWYLSVLTRIVG